MPSGIQAWNSAGTLLMDQSTLMVKFIGTLNIGTSYTGGTKSGSLYVPEWAQYPLNTPFFARADGGFNSDGYDANITIANNTIYWDYPFEDNTVRYYNGVAYYAGRPDQKIIYGLM